ncbi:MAG: hypothetical protein KQ78_01792 [Candidatus Izimaplasma bacterium HR2]|nr:MAG: hypothetical protein KQ78_01792 [Candidatus Izimaplasma bacterium HR2]
MEFLISMGIVIIVLLVAWSVPYGLYLIIEHFFEK